MAKIVKRKMKKSAIYLFAALVAIFVISILAINYYNDYKYRQTNEFKLLEKGYNKEETQILLEKLNNEKITELLNKEKDERIIPILNEKYYIEKNLEKYLEFYDQEKEKSTYDIVAMVNVKANTEWYENAVDADTTKGNLLLVNKFNKLSNDYTPENLVSVSNWYCYGTNQLTKEAYEAYINLYNKAKEENLSLIINSSYRDYKNQESTYNSLKQAFGTKKADNQAARPGHSEHETGLSFDIFSKQNTTTSNFKDSAEYKWLKEHAYKYGFIERYPEGKEYLTGYNYESWHWRFVGIEVATKIQEEEITFDEYYAYYIENQN